MSAQQLVGLGEMCIFELKILCLKYVSNRFYGLKSSIQHRLFASCNSNTNFLIFTYQSQALLILILLYRKRRSGYLVFWVVVWNLIPWKPKKKKKKKKKNRPKKTGNTIVNMWNPHTVNKWILHIVKKLTWNTILN